MAAAEPPVKECIQCGYCLEKGDQMVDPRSLPCKHVFCYDVWLETLKVTRLLDMRSVGEYISISS